jgi:hypothetical protein
METLWEVQAALARLSQWLDAFSDAASEVVLSHIPILVGGLLPVS